MPKRMSTITPTRVFYGWYIVGATFLLRVFISGVITKGVTTLVTPLATTFGWSYAQISLAMSLRGAEEAVLGPFFGRAVDRWPAKWLVLIGVTVMVLGLLLLSQTSNLAMYYVSFMIISLGASLGVVMAPTATIARWFQRDIGKVNGIVAMGIGLGGFAVPLLVLLIDVFGWQTSLIIIAGVSGAVSISMSFIFRDRPQDYGLFPDGRSPDKSGEADSAYPHDFNIGARQALRMRAFWQLGGAKFLKWAGVGAVTLHVVPYLNTVGIDRPAAAWTAMVFLIVSIPARFAFGWAADKFAKRYVAAVSVVLMAAGLYTFSVVTVDSSWLAVLFIIVYGIGLGGATPVEAPLIREYFGSQSFGAIFGLSQVFVTTSSLVVPPLVGWVFDTRGVYHPVWLVLSIASLIAAGLLVTLPRPAPATR